MDGEKGGFWGADKVLFSDTGSGYTGTFTLKIHQSVHFLGSCPALYVYYPSINTVHIK